jgi:hypothetical protein
MDTHNFLSRCCHSQHSTLNTQHYMSVSKGIEIMATRDLFTTRLSITDTNENNNSTTRCE